MIDNCAIETSVEFAKWCGLFSGQIFVQIVVYADESGTHDEAGLLPGSEVAVVAGYAAKVDSWIKFQEDWTAILREYSAPYFHFREFANASAVIRKKREPSSHQKDNPYNGWNTEKLDKFLYALAEVASAGSKVPVGGYVDTQGYAKFLAQTPEEKMGNPHEGGVWWFYDSAITSIAEKWPRLQRPISFFFDQSDDAKWRNTIDSVHHSYKKRNARIKEITFDDKKDNCPLQAADMVAYRLRQIAGKYCEYDLKIPESMPRLDQILFGKFVGRHQFERLFPHRA